MNSDSPASFTASAMFQRVIEPEIAVLIGTDLDPAGAPFDAVSATAGPVARGSVARVGIATAITAACGYAVLYLAARKLEPAGFAVFGVFWGAFGLVAGAANGLLQEATREVRAAGTVHSGGATASTRPIWVAVGV